MIGIFNFIYVGKRGERVKDLDKRNGTCSSDDACCSGCGCMNGTVVYAGGQNCQIQWQFCRLAKCEILRIWLAIHALQSSLEVRYVLMKPRFAIYVVQRSLEAQYTIIRPRFIYAQHDVIQ